MEQDYWKALQQYTPARIAMGRAGNALPSNEVLKFRMAHALAKDAVYSVLETESLCQALHQANLTTVNVCSQVDNRMDYLRNPNKGRVLNTASMDVLKQLNSPPVDLCIIIADGLSAEAVNTHAVPVIVRLIERLNDWTIAPVVIASQARVALSDGIGQRLQAQIALILIGERPGLSSPHSLGAYLTYQPREGNTDETRNCVSNIQPDGLSYDAAADKLSYLLHEMRIRKISGVALKDNQEIISITENGQKKIL